MERTAPERLEVGRLRDLPPAGAQDLPPRPRWIVEEGRQEFVRRPAVVQRLDERLHDRDRPVERPRVPPGLERVRLGDVPLAVLGGLVLLQTETEAQRDLEQRLPEAEIGRRVEDRIATEDCQEVDAPAPHVVDKIPDRRDLVDRLDLRGSGMQHGGAGVSEPVVDQVRERVDRGRRLIPRDHQTAAGVPFQIGGGGRDQAGLVVRERLLRSGSLHHTRFRGQRHRQERHAGRPDREPVVRQSTGGGRDALDRVETAHALLPAAHAAAVGEVTRVAQAAGRGDQDVGVERHDDVGPGEVVAGLDPSPEGDAGAEPDVVPAGRLVLVPLRPRETGEQGVDLIPQGRRRDGSGQDPQACAAKRKLRPQRPLDPLDQGVPGPDFAELEQELRAIGIVKPQHHRLGEDVRGSQARRVIRVPLDLGGTSFVALGQKTRGVPAEGRGGGEEPGTSRHHRLRHLHVRHDRLERLARARAEPRESQ